MVVHDPLALMEDAICISTQIKFGVESEKYWKENKMYEDLVWKVKNIGKYYRKKFQKFWYFFKKKFEFFYNFFNKTKGQPLDWMTNNDKTI